MQSTTARTLLRRSIVCSEPARGFHGSPLASFLAARRPIGSPRCLNTTPRSQLLAPSTVRAIHTSPALWKGKKESKREARKGGASAPATSSPSGDEEGGSKHPPPNPEDPLDMADVKSRLEATGARAREGLRKAQAGGRFSEDALGALRVAVDKKSGATYALRELGQVVSRGGRSVSVLVHEEGYVKAIMSAVQGSPDFNQQPQRAPDNELELVLKIEPEKRDDVLKRVKAACHDWRERVRQVRQKRDKQHTAWLKERVFGPDAKRQADKQLEKVIKTAIAEVDAVEKEALKQAEK